MKTWSDLINKYPDKFIVGATIDVGIGWYDYVEEIVNDCNLLISKIDRRDIFNRSGTLLIIKCFSNSNPCGDLIFKLNIDEIKKCECCGNGDIVLKLFGDYDLQILCKSCMTDFENKLKLDQL